MRKIETEILVIGGGATGTGVVRDLALRGFKTVLVEKGDLTHGTTGRYHGLLHSGGRYAVRDPQAARECIEENRILRRILPHCIEDTGGFFVVTPWDDPAYADRFLEGCRGAGIPVEELTLAQMLREEPLLNPRISRCFRVPDGSADSFLAADANAESARQHGAVVLPYHQVSSLLVSGDRRPSGTGPADGGRVLGACVTDRVMDEQVEIYADLVVNAAGAWAGQIAASAGITVVIIPGKGTMLAANHRLVDTVINRCKLPGDGDILVPAHTVSVIGTTDIKVMDPDHFPIEPWEVRLMLEEGEKLIPGFRGMRMLRAWAGVRPLYRETTTGETSDNRQVTRAFVLLDHEARDGVPGLVTITSGKWTTYRKMAEVTADLVCAKLGVQRSCRTHLEPLPGAEKHGYHRRSGRLAEVEKGEAYGSLVCECELATEEDVLQAIDVGQAKTIDDVRRDVRLGMGPCQGGFCTLRVAGMLHARRRSRVEEANVALRDFLLERWKGLLPVLWGQQLRQERLDELIYLNVLGADHLPGPESSRLAPVLYDAPTGADDPRRGPPATEAPEAGYTADTRADTDPEPVRVPLAEAGRDYSGIGAPLPHDPSAVDVLVIGAGLAGLAAAWHAVQRGRRVRVIAKGWGVNHWNAGCVDVIGSLPGVAERVISPAESLVSLARAHPGHPYARLGLERVAEALQAFQDLCARAGYPLHGSLERNWLLPTALGALRPTCLAPETMIAGDASRLSEGGPTLIVGFERFADFYPDWIADNLASQGFPAAGLTLELANLRERRFVNGRVLAQQFDTEGFRTEVAAALKPRLGKAARIGFPAVLGLRAPIAVLHDLEARLGLPVFEIPVLPPSIPGIRLHNLLVDELQKSGARVLDGMLATGSERTAGQVSAVWTEAAARRKTHRAAEYVLATGGILGGGLLSDDRGILSEPVFDLFVRAPGSHTGWFRREFLATEGHPVYTCGVHVDGDFRPLGPAGEPAGRNLSVVGGALAGWDPVRERSLEGLALATGWFVGGRV